MRFAVARWTSAGLVAATILVAIWGWVSLPAGSGIDVHVWDLQGRRHTAVSREVVWAIPVAALCVLAGMTRGARRGVERAVEAYQVTLVGVAGALFVAEALLVWRAGHPHAQVMQPAALSVAVLLVALGNVLGKARHNAVFGLRTPWTLADARVWDKTHRFLGRGWVLGGLILMLVAFRVSNGTGLGLSIAAAAALPPIVAILWSHRLHRQRA